MELQKISEKWQKKWKEDKIFEPEPDDRPKFFSNAPYPYINAYQHIGHLFTYMRTEAFARYKRLQGFNVLYPQGWHVTGSPIVQAAKRVKEKEPKQLKIMKDMGFEGEKLTNFEDPKYWIKFFAPEFVKDYSSLGMSVDWRREFITSELNPSYDKFIRWQFRKLKEKGYVIKGKFPVVWDPKENLPVGDHDRVEGEGETPKDFIWIKFRMKDSDLILIAGTTRPDALWGQTHLWVDPDATYQVVQVEDEKWVVGHDAVQKIKDQHTNCEVINTIKSKELIGKWAQGPFVDYPLYIIPAWFIDSNVGSGIVYSALEDPVDLIEMQHIHENPEIVEKYGLDKEVTDKLQPISIIEIPGMSDNLGQDMIDKYKITSPKEKDKVKDSKDELNKTVFRKGIMKNNCGKYSGMTVPKAQEAIKKDLIEAKDAVMFYELTGKVVSRSLTECVVKMVTDQWFLDYNNEEWKKDAHKCLNQMTLYPEKSRNQFEYVIDWLHEWACTREEGIGTKLPWDEKWLIESLSDSTIYLAYYTIVHILNDIPIEQIDDALYDYVLLGKGSEDDLKCDKELARKMRKSFDYWYPFDFRNSGKDLIQNHLTFLIFNHVAIFPEDKWPKGIGVNGWVTVDGQKMSKSLGNMIPVRTVVKDYGPDACRLTILSGGESMDDPNWETNMVESLPSKLLSLLEFSKQNYNKGREDKKDIDKWMESKLNRLIKEATEAMELTFFRTAIQKIFFGMNRALKHYLRRCNDSPNKEVISKFIEAQALMLTPFSPHICEEIWESIGKKGYISLADWPKCDESKISDDIEANEAVMDNVRTDIAEVLKLANIKSPNKITLFVSHDWKYQLMKELKKQLEKTRNPGEIIKGIMATDLKQHSKEVMKMIPMFVKDTKKIPEIVFNTDTELKKLENEKQTLEKEFSCNFEIVKAADSDNPKSNKALPAKPAIVAE